MISIFITQTRAELASLEAPASSRNNNFRPTMQKISPDYFGNIIENAFENDFNLHYTNRSRVG